MEKTYSLLKPLTDQLMKDVRAYCAREIATMWDEVLRFENPHDYYVDLSDELWELKNRMIEERRN